ncbi:noggin-like isoform X1 [Macrosteles quadrilineatus]|uniref:noggin-like isoform X1 n=2 Tax=Macrosteles quadrilineatus TaxID=74068 RepID=UPI0023E294A1|nr:noggin-like isoform X1 [Macrosteles quadrilineatus]
MLTIFKMQLLPRHIFLPLTVYFAVHCVAEDPDHTGLVASPALLLGPDMPLTLPLKFWANSRRSALKPRRRDLHEPTLLTLLGQDYDPRWMRTARHNANSDSEDEPERKTVRALRALLNNSTSGKADQLQLPEGLPPEYRELVKSWLVRRATCPIRFVWNDLGPYFWPRWLRRGECVEEATCSWPPGMGCVPGGARNLNVLRWHCRLRKNMHGKKKKSENNVWTPATTEHQRSQESMNKRKKRKKYRCLWIKVPYPVPEDCVCACS